MKLPINNLEIRRPETDATYRGLVIGEATLVAMRTIAGNVPNISKASIEVTGSYIKPPKPKMFDQDLDDAYLEAEIIARLKAEAIDKERPKIVILDAAKTDPYLYPENFESEPDIKRVS